MQPIIAETSLICQKPNGQRRPLRLYLRAPYQDDDGVWAYPCHAEGLLDAETTIFGEGSFHALILALRFLELYLCELEKRGAQFAYDDAEGFDPFPINQYFGELME